MKTKFAFLVAASIMVSTGLSSPSHAQSSPADAGTQGAGSMPQGAPAHVTADGVSIVAEVCQAMLRHHAVSGQTPEVEGRLVVDHGLPRPQRQGELGFATVRSRVTDPAARPYSRPALMPPRPMK